MTNQLIYTRPDEAEIISFAEKHLSPCVIRGKEIVAQTCPFCHGGNNSDRNTFYLSTVTGQYICHRGHCAKRGGFPSLLKHFGQSMKFRSVAGHFTPVSAVPKPRTHQIDSYFSNRGISAATLDAFQVGADNSGNIFFPFYVEGELIYAKYRKPAPGTPSSPKEWQEAGAKPVLFGMDDCVPDQPLYITEGQIDAMSLYEAGIRNVVSVPCGCENFEWVEPCWDWLEKFEKIVLFGDDDPPGKKMVRTLSVRLGEDRCFVVEDYPAGCKDANDVLLKEGELALIDMASSAKEVPIRGLMELADVKNVDPTTIPRIKTMVPALDESINGLEEGAVTALTGEYLPV